MARTREFDPDQALDQAMALFWRKGYAATSMDDLVEETDVSRYGLYGVFGNKRELYRKALRRYSEQLGAQFLGDLLKPDASLPQIQHAFARLTALASSELGRRGCMLCNTATEVGAHDEEIAKEVRQLYDRVTRVFERALVNAKRKNQLTQSVDTAGWARQLTGLSQSLAVMARSRYPVKELGRHVKFSLRLLTKQ